MSQFQIKDYSKKIESENNDGLIMGITETAINLTAQAKLLAPVDFGELEGSIMWRSDNKTGGYGQGRGQDLTKGDKLAVTPEVGAAYVGTAVEYGIYQEFGTRNMSAQPYLRPAADIVQGGVDAITAVADALKNSVRGG